MCSSDLSEFVRPLIKRRGVQVLPKSFPTQPNYYIVTFHVTYSNTVVSVNGAHSHGIESGEGVHLAR